MTPSFVVRPTVAVGAVIFSDGGVVLVQRSKPPLAGHWTLPGGSVEPGESLATATAREVMEETGLVVSVGELVEVYEHVSHDSSGAIAFHYVILDYLCSGTGGVLAAGTDAAAVAVVAEGDFDKYGVNAATRRVIERGRALQGSEHPPAPARLKPVV